VPHIHTGPGEHDLTVSAFIVHRSQEGVWRLLLHRHRLLDTWLQIGGHVEIKENPWDALRHEVKEETGKDLDKDLDLTLSPPLVGLQDCVEHPSPLSVITHDFSDMDHRHIDLAWAFIAHDDSVNPAEGESQDLRWFDRDELVAFGEDQIVSNVRQIGLFVLDQVSQG